MVIEMLKQCCPKEDLGLKAAGQAQGSGDEPPWGSPEVWLPWSMKLCCQNLPFLKDFDHLV